LLDGLTSAQAAERVGGALHAIDGWPAADAQDWTRLREDVLAGLTRVVALESQAATRIEPPIEFPAMARSTVSDVITHVAVHNARHFGQIATLRQIQGTWPPPSGIWTW